MSLQPEDLSQEIDEEIARVREARHRISARFGHDPCRLVAHYIELQGRHQDRLIRAPEPEQVDETAA